MLKRLDNHIFKDHKGVISDQPHIHVLESLPKPRLVAWMLEKGHPFHYILVCIVPRLEQIKREGERISLTTLIKIDYNGQEEGKESEWKVQMAVR